MADDKKDIEIEPFPVYAPTLGIIGNIPPTMLDPRAFTNCNNIRLKDGVASKRTGYVAYADDVAIAGIPLLLFGYQKFKIADEYEILVTTTKVYYNADGTWTPIDNSLTANGDEDVRCSLAFIENYMVFTNGVDAPLKWNGDGNMNALGDWATYRPKVFVPYKERLLGFNDNKSGTETAIRVMYSHLGDFDNIDGEAGSGSNDFTRGMGNELVGAAELKDYVAVYKNRSCCLLDYIGGSSLYSLNAHIQGVGLLAPHCIANLGSTHIFLGSDWNFHEWNGGWELNHIGDPIKKMLQSELTAASRAKAKRNFCVVSLEQREVTFFIVIGDNDYPTRMWTYNLDDRSWVKGTIASISGGGSVTTAGVERVLLGLSARTTHHYDYEALNDGASAIECSFQTGDFVLSKEGYQRRQRRYDGVDIDVKGYSASSKLSLEYSDAEGVDGSWSDAEEKTLTAVYKWTNWDFLKTARKLRFRFSDDTKSQSFHVRYYGLNQKEGEIG